VQKDIHIIYFLSILDSILKIDSKEFKNGIYFAVLKGKEKKVKKFVILN